MSKQIIQGFPPMQKEEFKVYVRSLTFNQSAYIEDCLNGVSMQQTDFPYVHHVVDDCSTDGEQGVIKAWMEKNCDMENAEYYNNDFCTITLVRNNKNPNCTLAAYFLKKNMYGNPKKTELFSPWREACPYEAICEGDDLWISEKKLQRQYDTLEAHREVDICSCGAIREKDGVQVGIIQPSEEERILQLEEIITGGGGYIATNTLVLRTNLFNDNFKFWQYFSLDYFWQIRGSLRGGMYFIPDCMSIYRVCALESWTERVKQKPIELLEWKLRSLETLGILNMETGQRYNNVIMKKKKNDIFLFFQVALQTDVYDTTFRNLPVKRKLETLRILIKKFFFNG